MAALTKKVKSEIITKLRADAVEVSDDIGEDDLVSQLPMLTDESYDELSAKAKAFVDAHEEPEDDDGANEPAPSAPKKAPVKKTTKKAPATKNKTTKKAPAKKTAKKAPANSSSSKKKTTKKETTKEDSPAADDGASSAPRNESGWRSRLTDEEGMTNDTRSNVGVVDKFREIVIKRRLKGLDRDFNACAEQLRKTHSSVNLRTVRTLHSIWQKTMDDIEKQGIELRK